MKTMKNNEATIISSLYYYEAYHRPFKYEEANYVAGDTFLIDVTYDWKGISSSEHPNRDYTLKVYSKQNLEIKDSKSRTNMWHMDGQYPSGFTKSHYRKDTTKWTPEFTPRSLSDIWTVSNNLTQFLFLLAK